MSNKETYKRKHKYLDKQISHLEKTNYYNRTLIANLKKKKLKLKDKILYEERDTARQNKYKAHEYFKRALSMTAWLYMAYVIY